MSFVGFLALAFAATLLVFAFRYAFRAASRRRARLSALRHAQHRQEAVRARRGLPRFDSAGGDADAGDR